MIGLPSTDGNVTRFNPPDWYMQACNTPVYLFLDELNRASIEVMQAAFQVVLDRELNGWKLHPDTKVFAAVNVGGQYTVNEIDPALLRRFFVVDLEPSVADWIKWAKEVCLDASIIEFHEANNGQFLDPPKNNKGFDPSKVQPVRASWERLSMTYTKSGLGNDPEAAVYRTLAIGFVGIEAASEFVQYARNNNVRFSGLDLLNDYTNVKKKIARIGADGTLTAVERCVGAIVDLKGSLDEKQLKNYDAFMTDLPGEHVMAFWSKLTAAGINNLKEAGPIVKILSAHVMDAVDARRLDKRHEPKAQEAATSPAPTAKKRGRPRKS